MTSRTSGARRRRITSADVGRYLKQLAAANRDPLTGNPAMSAVLAELSKIFIEGHNLSASDVLVNSMKSGGFKFDDRLDIKTLSLHKIREILDTPRVTKVDLVAIGTGRFAIPKSRMNRASREEIISLILSAVQHEESLNAISEEARRHRRTS